MYHYFSTTELYVKFHTYMQVGLRRGEYSGRFFERLGSFEVGGCWSHNLVTCCKNIKATGAVSRKHALTYSIAKVIYFSSVASPANTCFCGVKQLLYLYYRNNPPPNQGIRRMLAWFEVINSEGEA